MLGWFISAYTLEEQLLEAPTLGTKVNLKPLIRWSAGISGLDWMESLCKNSQGVFLGGDGYPFKYAFKSQILKPILLETPTKLYWKEFIEGEIPTSGGEGIRNSSRIKVLAGNDWIIIEAFDQS
jgi:hypothetical protein